MMRSLFAFIAALAGLAAVGAGALADQTGPAPAIVHNVDEALHAAPGANVVHGGSISFGGGTAAVLAFDFGTETPRDAATGQASGRRQHAPITLVRQTDSASPLLLQALAGGTVGLVVGTDTFILHGVSVVSSKHVVVKGPTSLDTHELEQIMFTFQKIEVSNVSRGKSATDNWLAPGAPTPSPSPHPKP
jgi:type VI secretion system secreted protein Hcp